MTVTLSRGFQLSKTSSAAVMTPLTRPKIIASLQASRAAVQESQLANATAASIKRVTILTFIYPPLTLASVRTARLDPSTDSDVHARACWA
jgi:hypothetical protein